MPQRSAAIILLFLLTRQISLAQFAQVQPDLPISPEERSQLLDNITRNINNSYVFPDEITVVVLRFIAFPRKP
jgi:hypothetical protein